MSDSLWTHGLQPARLFCPWDSPGKNTAVGCRALLQRICPTQGSNPHVLCLLHWKAGSLPVMPPGNQPCISTMWHIAPILWVGREVILFVLLWKLRLKEVKWLPHSYTGRKHPRTPQGYNLWNPCPSEVILLQHTRQQRLLSSVAFYWSFFPASSNSSCSLLFELPASCPWNPANQVW